jgi:hypothetical protein
MPNIKVKRPSVALSLVYWRGIVQHFIQYLSHEDVKALHMAFSKVLQMEQAVVASRDFP